MKPSSLIPHPSSLLSHPSSRLSHPSSLSAGFTLIELLIVIGIIAILAGVLMGNYSGIVERVRSAKCQTNLKNLANACGVYAACGHYPFAESAQYTKTTGGTDDQGVEIREFKGWVSWDSQSTRFPISGNSPASITHLSYANSNPEKIFYAITNGAIWSAVGQNRDCYVCPVHVDACRKQGVRQPGWSYQMNAYFGCEPTPGKAELTEYSYIESGSLSRADRILLFSEIQGLSANSKDVRKRGVKIPEAQLTGSDGAEEMCGCLRYKSLTGSSGNGTIGFNHVQGRDIVGHVAFADGHVETLAAPKNGDFVNLTDWLCQGMDVVIDGKNYQKINDSEVQ